MLPLRPPPQATDPGYPVRSRLLTEPALRRHALAALAAFALAGCDNAAPPAQPLGGSAPPPRPVAPQNLPQPKPPAHPDTSAPTFVKMGISAMPEPVEPQPLEGDIQAPTLPAPMPVLGEMPSINPPTQLDLPQSPDADV